MIFAKLKANPPEHRILFEDDENSQRFNFYLLPNIVSSTKFNPDKKLEQDEWFYVELDGAQIASMIDPYRLNETSTADLNHAMASDYSSIDAVYRVIEDTVIFTKVTDSFKIHNRKLFHLKDTGEAELVNEQESIEFKGTKDAYFDGDSRLYFRKFSTIRSMFPGIEVFFREATQQEKQTFLSNPLFDVEDIDPDQIGSRDSARIAAVLADESIGLADGSNADKILEAARTFEDVEIEITEDNKIVIKDTKELRTILDLVTSRYYISNITGKKMRSYGSAVLGSE